MKRLVPLSICLLLVWAANAQNRVASRVLESRAQGITFAEAAPFKSQGTVAQHAKLHLALRNGQLLSLDPVVLKNIFRQKPQALQLEIPAGPNRKPMKLELIQHQLLTEDFQVTTEQSNQQGIAYTPGIYYRGILKDNYESVVALSLFENEVIGVLTTPEHGNMVLGKIDDADPSAYVLFRDQDIIEQPSFTCDTEDFELTPEEINNLKTLAGTANRLVSNCVRVYLECEYNLTQEKGGATGAVNFMTGLFNVVATLYDNEGISTLISEIFVWTSPDPYPTTSTSDALYYFRNYRTNYNGDLAHLVSRGAPSGGGVAWVNGLCSTYGYAYSYIYSSYNPFPNYSWSVNVIAHEMGHNLGSRHTHACVWNGNNTALDGCGPQAGYSEGCTGPIPTNGGTIMSYCHLLSGVGINFNNGFGIQPGDLIRSYISNASCLTTCGPACQEISLSKTNVSCFGGADGSASATVSGGEAPYSYAWSNGQNTPHITGLIAGQYTLTVTDATNCEVISSVVIQQPASLNLSVDVTDESFAGSGNGSIDLQVSGGTAPYSYAWSNNATTQDISGLTSGTYSATVTDSKGCQNSISAEVQSNGCTSLINLFPFHENFESAPVNWSQSNTDDFNWTLNSGSTPTGRTGPSSAFEGNSYFYIEADGHIPYKTAELISDCIDFRNLENPVLSFAYSMNGSNIGSLTIEAGINGANYSIIWSLSGNQGKNWQTASIDLSLFEGQIIQLKIIGFTSNNTKGDIAIDALQIDGTVPPCNTPTLSVSQTNAACFGIATGSATVSASGGQTPYTYLWSTGAQTSTIESLLPGTYNVTVMDAANCPATAGVTIESPDALGLSFLTTNESSTGIEDGSIDLTVAGGVPGYSFNWSNGAQSEDLANLGVGVYSVTVTDSNNCQKTGEATIIVQPPCNPSGGFPYAFGFESGLGNWEQATNDDFDWTVYSGKTPTGRTGPNAAFEGSQYLYTEATGNTGLSARIISPCIDLSGAVNPVFSFAYNMNGSQMGNLAIQVSTDGGSTWSSDIWSLSGHQGSNWRTASLALNSYVGQNIRLSFIGTIGGQRSDMAIDDLRFMEAGSLVNYSEPPAGLRVFRDLVVYPNPVFDYFSMDFTSLKTCPYQLTITDISGRPQLIMQGQAEPGKNNVYIDLGLLNAGIYYLRIEGEQTLLSQKLVKMQW